MIRPKVFLRETMRAGIELYSGVPCSYLTPLINAVISSPEVEYVGATNEGDAVAIACGAELGGKPAAVLFQNSGFGNAVSPLTSLTSTFDIPVLLLVTWRGQPDGPSDEPQHELMGQITPGLFDLIGIRWQLLPSDEEKLPRVLDEAATFMRTERRPYALVCRKNVFEPCRLTQDASSERAKDAAELAAIRSSGESRHAKPHQAVLDPDDVLRTVQRSIGRGDVIIATTGFTGRALYAQGDFANQFYMVGSMGCASSLGLGLALAQPQRKVVVLDGDGAFLMRMGAVATIGHELPANLVHVLLDNGVHDSTGAQATVSETIDPIAVARACGYPRAATVDSLNDLADAVRGRSEVLTLLHVKTKPRGDRKLPRPDVTPPQVAARFRTWLEVDGKTK